MIVFQRTLKFNTDSEQKGIEKMKAIVSLINNLDHDDLLYLSQLSERKKGWVKKAKPYENFL